VAGQAQHTHDPDGGRTDSPLPKVVDHATWQAELDGLRRREKAHTREGDAIAAARRRLPVVEVGAATELIGPDGPLRLLDAFEGREELIAYYFMWYPGRSAAEQCEGCTLYASQVRELSFLHSRDVTYAVFCQGPYAQSARYREFMHWDMPWYSPRTPSTSCSSAVASACSTWCVTSGTGTGSSRPTGPTVAVWRR
jgi:predicted dithiol-disulfide oxidoreductase (DUF899 family)